MKAHVTRLAVLAALGALLFGGSLAVPAVVPSAIAAQDVPVTITSPEPGAALCTPIGGTFRVTGETLPSAAVELVETYLGSIGTAVADDSGHWSIPVVAERSEYHVVAVAQLGSDRGSTSVDFTLIGPYRLDLLEIAPAAISPGGRDGYLDVSTVWFEVLAPGSAHVSILDGAGEPVARSETWPVGEKYRQEYYTWTWDGRDEAGEVVPSGAYTARVTWERAQPDCVPSTVEGRIVVDDNAPRFGAVSHDVGTFYPRRDDAFGPFRDWVVTRVAAVSERVLARPQVFHHGGGTAIRLGPVRSWAAGSSPSWAWDGRRRDGTMLPEGSYDVRFRLSDVAGNVSYTPLTTVTLSHRHVVAHTATLRKPAAAYASAVRSGGCGSSVSSRLSGYDRGLLLRYCGSARTDALAVHWLFAVPRAVVYRSFAPFAYGRSPAGTALPFLARDYGHGRLTALGRAWPAQRLHALAAVAGGSFVSRYRTFRLVGRFTGAGRAAYDLRTLGVTIRYGTLEG